MARILHDSGGMVHHRVSVGVLACMTASKRAGSGRNGARNSCAKRRSSGAGGDRRARNTRRSPTTPAKMYSVSSTSLGAIGMALWLVFRSVEKDLERSGYGKRKYQCSVTFINQPSGPTLRITIRSYSESRS